MYISSPFKMGPLYKFIYARVNYIKKKNSTLQSQAETYMYNLSNLP